MGRWGQSARAAASTLACVLALAVGAGAQATRVRILQPVNPHQLVTLRGNTPPLARSGSDRGPAPDDLYLSRMLLVLKRSPNQEAALRKLLDEQQTKSSPQYHQWLTPGQFGAEFGPAEEDVQTISGWLMDQGFELDRVTPGRSVIEFSGTAGLVRRTFHTSVHSYEIKGKAYWSNARDPEIPAALAPVVEGIASLNNFPVHRQSRQTNMPIRVRRTPGPAPLYTITSPDGTVLHPLAPADFATIYNVQPLWSAGIDGTGETIAIVADSNIGADDVANFRSLFGLPPNPVTIILNGPDPGAIQGPEGEADLDAEWSGAVAKAAKIDLVVSEDTTSTPGFELSALYIVDNNLAPVMSVSFGACESQLGVAGNAFFSSLWEQAAAQGISVIVAAGDQGSAACDEDPTETAAKNGLAVSGVASTPFDTAVGGTDFDEGSDPSSYWSSTNNPTNQSSALSYIPESTWNDSCAQTGVTTPCMSTGEGSTGFLAGGGGPSNCGILTGTDPNATCSKGYPKPAWQTGPGVPQDSARDIPDVSLFSGLGRSGSFYFFCEVDQLPSGISECNLVNGEGIQEIGGTSVSAQTFAGVMALVDQKTGQRQGDPNYILYKLAAQTGASCKSSASAVQNKSCVFYDVVTGNNSLPCVAGSPNCGPAGANAADVIEAPGSNPPAPAWNAVPGYDLATGLGSVNVANLVNAWNSVSFTPSTTALTISPASLTHGQPATVSIQVSGSGGTPTGSVSLLGGPNGTNPASGIASFTLNNGAATETTTSLPGGTYNVTAHYAGDGNFGASDSKPIQVTVGKENSVTTLGIVTFGIGNGGITNSDAHTVAYGSPYTLQVNVANSAGVVCSQSQVPASGCPSGTVNLTDNGAPLNPTVNSLNSLGQMDDNLIQLAAGSHSIVATYLGDNSFVGSTSSPDAVSVSQAYTDVALSPSVNTTVQGGSSLALSATVSTQSNGAAPTGTVQFLNGSTPLSGTVSYTPTAGSGTSNAALTASLNAVLSSTATITAVYSGDANYSGSNSPGIIVTVTPGFTMSVNPSTVAIPAPGQTGSTTATVTSGGGFSGAVALACQIPASMAETTCSFSPAAITTSGQSKLTITTTAPQTAAALFDLPNGPHRWLGGVLLSVLALLLLLAVFSRRRRLHWAFALCLVLAVAVAGCGGGGQSSSPSPAPPDPGTPAGTYVITVAATGSASSGPISQTVLVKVIVQ